MNKGAGRRRIIWSLFWIAVLGSSSAGQGGTSLFVDVEPGPPGHLVAEYRCVAEQAWQADPY